MLPEVVYFVFYLLGLVLAYFAVKQTQVMAPAVISVVVLLAATALTSQLTLIGEFGVAFVGLLVSLFAGILTMAVLKYIGELIHVKF